jgi:hypothetical protein
MIYCGYLAEDMEGIKMKKNEVVVDDDWIEEIDADWWVEISDDISVMPLGVDDCLVQRRNIFGQLTYHEIPMHVADAVEALSQWQNGDLIQDAFPSLCPEDREFIMTGLTPMEWDEHMGDEEDDDC